MFSKTTLNIIYIITITTCILIIFLVLDSHKTKLLHLNYENSKLLNLKAYWGEHSQSLVRDFGQPHFIKKEGNGVESWIYYNQYKTSAAGPKSIIFRIEKNKISFGMFEAKP